MPSVDNEIDYEKLLVKAQKKHSAYKRKVDSYEIYFEPDPLKVPDDIQKKLEAAEGVWFSWLKANITDKGFRLDFDLFGRPICLMKVVAERHADYV